MDGYVHPEFLAETGWLAERLGDPSVLVFDCTTHLIPDPKATYQVVPARADFEAAHIPGAQFIDVQKDVSDNARKLRFMAPAPDALAAAMRRFGVNGDSRIVLYSTANVWWATRVWWLLRMIGFDNAAVLNGGFQKWRAENRPVESGPGRARPEGTVRVREVRPLMVDKARVRAAIGDGRVCTINALLPEQHSGTGGNSYGRRGHIAGSVNVPAAHLIDPERKTFLPAEKLRQQFSAVGALDREVIAYCGGGIAATADALALALLGHENVVVYDASLSEWAPDPALPMETG
ncbi:MAG TPA: rhodanese-like domain-containing protein [Acetobacteraceae bacterium]|nr:rhodanese-like domain-containing protein [Acetobacteraceae bacterium]